MATKEQLARIIASKAGGLCTPEGDRNISSRNQVHQMSESYDPDPDSFYDDSDDPWGIPGQSSSFNQTRQGDDFTYNANTASVSKIPNAIKQSMLEHKIDTSSLSNTSVIDQLGIKSANQQKRQQVVETRQPIMQTMPQTIDYALIKTIVKECIEESKREMLTENNNLKTIRLVNGNIKLVDNSGNIYSAKLEKTGNINDKKR